MFDLISEMFNLVREWPPIISVGIGISIIVGVACSAYHAINGAFGPNLSDKEFAEKVENGTGILLTCDQYLSLHNADPERYPLDTKKLRELLRNGDKIHMNQDEFDKLWHIAYQEKSDKEDTLARVECLEELRHMQKVLGALIEKQEKENKDTAQRMVEQTIQLVVAEQGTTTTR